MALKITLKPHERMIIAGAAVTNGDSATAFLVENKVPILREKDILTERDADSPARRIYYVVQLMYLDHENPTTYHTTYWNLVREFLDAAPSALELIKEISKHLLGGRYYKALKTVRRLIQYEHSLLSAGQGPSRSTQQ